MTDGSSFFSSKYFYETKTNVLLSFLWLQWLPIFDSIKQFILIESVF